VNLHGFPFFLAFGGLLYAPPGMLWLDLTLFRGIVGFFIYPPGHATPVMGSSISLRKRRLAPPQGSIGLFGYLGRTAQGQGHRHNFAERLWMECPPSMVF